MSETKHTPGPWRVVWATKDQTLSIVAGENAGAYSETIIAEIGGLFGHCEAANARLIAAAPDMLAALMAADEACSQIVAPDEWPRKEIRAAIAKAGTQ